MIDKTQKQLQLLDVRVMVVTLTGTLEVEHLVLICEDLPTFFTVSICMPVIIRLLLDLVMLPRLSNISTDQCSFQWFDVAEHKGENHTSFDITGVGPDGQIDEIQAPDDFPDECLRFISEILMEEDLDDQTASLQDDIALQATEKSLLDALVETFPSSSVSSSSGSYPSLYGQNIDSPDEINHQSCSSHSTESSTGGNTVSTTCLYSNPTSYGSYDSFSDLTRGQGLSPASTVLGSEVSIAELDWFKEACKNATEGGHNDNLLEDSSLINQGVKLKKGFNGTTVTEDRSRGKKNVSRNEDDDDEDLRRNKHLASYDEEYVEMEQYDDVLLCNEGQDTSSNGGAFGDKRGSNKKKTRGKKKGEGTGQAVDLRTLIAQCAQAVASYDLRNANEMLKKIRMHSSQYGDSSQRTAYYFANGLEARLAGNGWQRYKELGSKPLLASEILKAYRVIVKAMPFKRTSYFVANDAITRLAEEATRIHIVDFGIFLGFQWPGLIQKLAERKGGPPVLRITGIDFPVKGFRPAKRVEETGQRLAGYCQRFNVPFEYQGIAKSWDAVTLEDLKIEGDEFVAVNCLYMSRKLHDETVEESNPRDSFFKFIRKLNPNLLIHAIVNGIYNGPFFETRFREALFHYSSIYDIFEATIPRESNERLLAESHLYGTDALNVIACEGAERIERPETYRQWQNRMERAGFRKLSLNKKLVDRITAAVTGNYHKDFVVYENSHWLLQGWKGRILYAISCWTSA